jgi:O-methyltransferase involved in polyketide biosynthesis
MAIYCLDKLAELATPHEKAHIFERKLSGRLSHHIALRTRKYDALINDWIARNPSSTVVNLGCGFDTRYWRIAHQKCRYLELDLPEIIELKKVALKGKLDYELIGGSVLDPVWIEQVTAIGNRNIVLIAEGLFMYLPKPQVIGLFETFSEKLAHSQIIFEVVTEAYTHGFWKKIVEGKMKRELGVDAGASYDFGVRGAREIESYGKGLKVVGEWSYVEDPDVRPKIFRYLGLARTQWTVIASIN